MEIKQKFETDGMIIKSSVIGEYRNNNVNTMSHNILDITMSKSVLFNIHFIDSQSAGDGIK